MVGRVFGGKLSCSRASCDPLPQLLGLQGAAIALPLPSGFSSSIARFLAPESAFRCRNLAIGECGPHRTPPLPAFGRPLLTATGSAAGSAPPRAPPAGTRPAGLGPGPAPSSVPLLRTDHPPPGRAKAAQRTRPAPAAPEEKLKLGCGVRVSCGSRGVP